jgi:hypothetical protein
MVITRIAAARSRAKGGPEEGAVAHGHRVHHGQASRTSFRRVGVPTARRDGLLGARSLLAPSSPTLRPRRSASTTPSPASRSPTRRSALPRVVGPFGSSHPPAPRHRRLSLRRATFELIADTQKAQGGLYALSNAYPCIVASLARQAPTAAAASSSAGSGSGSGGGGGGSPAKPPSAKKQRSPSSSSSAPR